jgi:predicted RNA-binding protein YlxR (DUF448 family)
MRIPRNEPLTDNDGRNSPREREGSERRCVLSGRVAKRDDFVRLALSPDGEVLPDVLAKAPGRGAWIGESRPALEQALANGKLKGALARAFKTGALTIPADLSDRMEKGLLRAFLDRLGLEMRAGKLILGSDKISNEARMGKIAALYHASDAAEDGSRKLDQALRVGMDAEGTDLAGIRLPLDRTALSVALGRDNVVHLALADRASAARIAVPMQRLLNFLGAEDPPDAGADRAA